MVCSRQPPSPLELTYRFLVHNVTDREIPGSPPCLQCSTTLSLPLRGHAEVCQMLHEHVCCVKGKGYNPAVLSYCILNMLPNSSLVSTLDPVYYYCS